MQIGLTVVTGMLRERGYCRSINSMANVGLGGEARLEQRDSGTVSHQHTLSWCMHACVRSPGTTITLTTIRAHTHPTYASWPGREGPGMMDPPLRHAEYFGSISIFPITRQLLLTQNHHGLRTSRSASIRRSIQSLCDPSNPQRSLPPSTLASSAAFSRRFLSADARKLIDEVGVYGSVANFRC